MNAQSSSGSRKRSRKRGSGRANNSETGSNNKKRGGRNRAPKVDLPQFWGDPAELPRPVVRITSTPDVKAVVSSLGRPPVPGHETPAEHWFSLVYERAAVLAGALAAAGGLDETYATDDTDATDALDATDTLDATDALDPTRSSSEVS